MTFQIHLWQPYHENIRKVSYDLSYDVTLNKAILREMIISFGVPYESGVADWQHSSIKSPINLLERNDFIS